MAPCLDCERAWAELDRVKQKAEEDLRNAAVDRAGALREINKLKKKIADESDEGRRSPRDAEALVLEEYWLKKCVPLNGQKRTKIGVGTSRHKLALSRLGLYPMEELKTCVDRVALEPYVGPRGRTSNPDGARRYADLEHCIGGIEGFDKRIDAHLQRMAEIREEQREQASYKGPLHFPVPKILAALMQRELLVQRFGDSKHEHWMAECPIREHAGEWAVQVREDGYHKADVTCTLGCATQDVLEALGLSFKDLVA